MKIMHRRSFTAALAGLAAAAPAWSADSSRRTQFYTLDVFDMQQGTQPARMNDWLENSLLPKLRSRPVIVLEAVIAPHSPQIACIAGFSSLDEIWATLKTVRAAEPPPGTESPTETDPPFDTETLIVLEAAPYSPEIAVKKSDKPRYFELRQYHSPTASQLRELHERFAGPEIKIFHRSGIFPLFYSSTAIGPNMPNLTYLIPWDSLEAREKGWDKFNADPAWIKARKESIDKGGQIANVINVSIYRATPYSPVS